MCVRRRRGVKASNIPCNDKNMGDSRACRSIKNQNLLKIQGQELCRWYATLPSQVSLKGEDCLRCTQCQLR